MSVGRVLHELPPLYDERSRVLILGTMPSPKSRELGFYYMHPQNRFWKMLAAVFDSAVPTTVSERRELCLKHNIALWDVLASCEINGASDSSIKGAVPNDIPALLKKCPITAVFTTGKKAHELLLRFFPEIDDVCLPSTSPANRTISETDMLKEYRAVAAALSRRNYS